MTTVVATRFPPLIVSDSMCTHNGDKKFYTSKIFHVGDSIVGVAGDLSDAKKFIKWLIDVTENDMEEDTVDFSGEGFDALQVFEDGRMLLWDESLIPLDVENDFYAIGTGAGAAMGAMHAGVDAEKAVRIAMLVDPNTGGSIALFTPGD